MPETPAAKTGSPRLRQALLWALMAFILAANIISIVLNKRVIERQRVRVKPNYAKILANRKPPKPVLEAQQKQDSSVTGFRLEIRGKAEFKEQILKALQLIWQYDPATFRHIKTYIYVIRQASATGFAVENGIPSALISNKTAFKSLTWCAGAVSRQSFEAARLYENQKQKMTSAYPPPPGSENQVSASGPLESGYEPPEVTAKNEKAADGFQLSVLRAVGAPRSEIRLVERGQAGDGSEADDGL